MAQADELARLRDEVRGSAEREAMEIVTAARRDIRRIVMDARRELFVLSAQVQAALGEGGPGSPQIGPPAIAHDDDRAGTDDDLSAFAQEEWGFAPRSTVAAVLEEARADMAVLDKDARAVPIGAPGPAEEREHPSGIVMPEQQPRPVSFLASPAAEAPTEPQEGSSVRLFAAVFVLAAVAVVMGTVWMLRGSSDGAAAAVPAAEIAAAPSASDPRTVVPSTATPEPDPTSVRLSIEALRPAWIRATVDGQADAGQTLRAGETYEFTGRSIALRVGDAGAVRVSVNGGAPQPLGRDGQVVNREFSLEPAAAPGESRTGPDPFEIPGELPQPASAAPTPAAEPPLEATASAAVLLAGAAPAAVAATNGITRATSPEPAVDRTGSPPSPESTLVAAAQRWLDAYQRQDQVALAALSTPDVAITDERPTGERMPVTIGAIARTLERVSVQLAADTAVLTGMMTERALNGGLERSSPVSLVWVAGAGTWRLSQARLVSQSTLGQIFR